MSAKDTAAATNMSATRAQLNQPAPQQGMVSEFKSLAGDSLIYGVGLSLGGLVTLVLIPFLLRNVSAAQFGRFALAEMVAVLMLVVIGIGINVSLLAWYPRTPIEQRSHLIGTAFSALIAATLVGEVLLGLVFLTYGGKIIPAPNGELFALVAGVIAVENIWMLCGTVFRAEGRAATYVFFALVQALVEFIAIVVLVHRMRTAEAILWGRLIGDLVQLVPLIAYAKRFRPRWDLGQTLEMLKFSAPLVAATLASMWLVQFPRFFIEHFREPSAVGVFAMSAKIAAILSLGFVQPFGLAWNTALFRIYERVDAQEVYARVFTYYLLIGGVLATCLCLEAPQIAFFLGRKDFPLSTPVISIMAFSIVAGGLMYPLCTGPYVTNRTSRIAPPFVAAAALSLPIGWIAIKHYGVVGASAASLVVYLVLVVLLATTSRRIYKIQFQWKRLGKTLVALVLGVVIARMFDLGPNRLLSLITPFILVASVFAILSITNFFDSKELDYLRSLAPGFLARYGSAQ